MNSSIVRTAALGAIAILGVSSSTAQIARSGNAYTFKVKHSKGQSLSYTVTIVQSMAPGAKPVSIVMPMKQTTQSVDAKGVATMQVALGPATMDGRQVQPLQTQTTKIDTFGRGVGTSSPGSQFTAFPTKPIRVGESWTASVNMGNQAGNMTAAGTYVLRSVRRVNGVELAEVGITIKGSGPLSMNGSGTALFRTADGSLQSTTLKMSASMTNPQTNQKMSMSQDIKVVRK